IFDIGEAGGSFFIVMEMLNPMSAAAYLRHNGRLHWAEASRVAAECCQGLTAVHELGLIHRDIKPDNIMCGLQGNAKISDFGLVKELSIDAASLTESGLIAGTPAYMSPEQCCSKKLDPRTDLYSLGASYYSLLTG